MRFFFWVSFTIGVLSAQTSVDFSKQVQPLLRAKCQMCHGAGQQMSGLRLDQKAAAMAGGYSGPVIVAGNSASSKLIARVNGANGVARMPPGKPLDATEIDLLRRWIDSGATWPDDGPLTSSAADKRAQHWAFQPV